MCQVYSKNFRDYSEAYALYAEIVSGKDLDRKNATITYFNQVFTVWWESNILTP